MSKRVHALGRWLLLVALLVAARTAAGRGPDVPIQAPVTDSARVLSAAAVTRIGDRLVAMRDAGGVHMAVLTVRTTASEPIEDYANRIANAWGGGSKQRDDGVLFVLAVDDRRMRLEVGYGLEADLTDARARAILDAAKPLLRAADYDRAVEDVVGRVQARLAPNSLPADAGASPGDGGVEAIEIRAPVDDRAGLLEADFVERMVRQLADHERATGGHIAILVVGARAREHAERAIWEAPGGVLVVLAPDGYEPLVWREDGRIQKPSGTVSDAAEAALAVGDRGRALSLVVGDIMVSQRQRHAWKESPAEPYVEQRGGCDGGDLVLGFFGVMLFVIVLVVVVAAAARGGGGGFTYSSSGTSAGSSRSSFSLGSSSSFGSSSSSSFGRSSSSSSSSWSGGGGRFGGGGASSSW